MTRRVEQLLSPRTAALALTLGWGLLGLAFAARMLAGFGLQLPAVAHPGEWLRHPALAWLVTAGDVSVALLLARSLLPTLGAERALARLPSQPWGTRLRPYRSLALGLAGLLAARTLTTLVAGQPGTAGQILASLPSQALILALSGALACAAARSGALGGLLLLAALALSVVLPTAWQLPLLEGSTPALAWTLLAISTGPLGARVGPRLEEALASCRGLWVSILVRWTSRGALGLSAAALVLGVAQLEAGRASDEVWVELTTRTGTLRFRSTQAEAALSLAREGPALQAALREAIPGDSLGADPPLILTLDERTLREGREGLARRLATARVEHVLGRAAQSRPLSTFAQGAAVHLGHRVSGADPFWYRYQLGVYWARGGLSPDCLWDRRILAEAGQEAVGPALGEAACAAITSRLGPSGVADVLASWRGETDARPTSATIASSRQAWSRVLKPFGLTPEQLWESIVSIVLLSREDPRASFPLPRVRASVAAEDDPIGWMVYAEPDFELPRGWQIECRARWETGGRVQTLRPTGWAGGAQTFFVRTRELLRPPQVQVGVVNPSLPGQPTTGAVWEDWAEWKLQDDD
ncbi:MAG: hypothetical protein JKY65_20635 [Planctomycetes bacterium]|nr:hypothetical protein [Planctomycetota bacterium]